MVLLGLAAVNAPKLEALEDEAINVAIDLNGLCIVISRETGESMDFALRLLRATSLLPGLLGLWGLVDGSPLPDPLTEIPLV